MFYARHALVRSTFLCCLLVLLAAGCSSKIPVNFKVHSEPEGAHVIFRQNSQPWIYLGVTPLDTIQILHEDNLEDNHTLSLKAMRCGYLEQAKEWNGEELIDEFEKQGVIFWTPRLIKAEE